MGGVFDEPRGVARHGHGRRPVINMDANLGEILLVYDTISMAREDLSMASLRMRLTAGL